MRSVTARAAAAVDGNHQPVWRVEVTAPGGSPTDLPVLAGSLIKDGNAWPSTKLRVKVPTEPVPYSTTPGIPPDRLPHGTTCRVLWGIGAPTTVIAERLVLLTSELTRPKDMWDLAFGDITAVVAMDKLPRSEWPPASPPTTLSGAVGWLLDRTIPGQYTLTPDASPLPTEWLPSGDPWLAAVQLVQQANKQITLAPNGQDFTIRPQPVIGTPVDTITAADNVTGYDVLWERAYNSVCLDYRAQDGTYVTGRWDDTRTGSPLYGLPRSTYYDQRDGQPTQAQADAAALAIAQQVAGRMQTTRLYTIPRPWLEPWDTVTVNYLGGVTGSALVESIEAHLDNEPMTVTLRNSRYPDLGPI